MKRTLILLLAAAFLLPACKQGFRTETLSLEEDIPFREGSQNSLDIKLNIDFPVAGYDREVLQAMCRNIRSHTLGENYTEFKGSLKELAADYRNTLVNDYMLTNQSMLEEMEMQEDEAPFLNWGCDIQGSFGEKWEDWLMYQVEEYSYYGGAHGLNATVPLVFDTKTGEPVTWDQIARNVSDEKIMRLIDKHKYDAMEDMIREDDIDRDNIFFVDRIEPSDSFTVGENGITFYYQPYDVAPYVFGVIEITVPWEELR